MRTYCFCGWWVVVSSLAPFIPNSCWGECFMSVSVEIYSKSYWHGMWSVSEEWKVQCLNRKISGYSESDKTGMAYLCVRPFGLFTRKACEIGQNNIMSLGRPCTAPYWRMFWLNLSVVLAGEKHWELLVELLPSRSWAGLWCRHTIQTVFIYDIMAGLIFYLQNQALV